MNSHNRITNITGWLVFIIAFAVYYASAERVGSLWDCGEFIAGAYKLQVVHPPGAPLFLLIGRMFTWVASLLSNNPEDIAFSVNLLSGICSALTATFVCWVTMILGKLAMTGRNEEPDNNQVLVIAAGGVVAGLCTAFATSVWFSAVEGEVYAMSTFFTALTLWAMLKWYNAPDVPASDKWIVFAVYSAALSIGVHLLSLLTFPALALFYYFKKTKNPTFKGMVVTALIGTVAIGVIQTLIIIGIPSLFSSFELLMVNSFGLPFGSGLIPLLLVLAAIFYFSLRWTQRNGNGLIQRIVMSLLVAVIGFSTIGVVMIRANANPPINMNNPSDPMRVVPYLNREQYGERPLLRGPQYNAKYDDIKTTDRYGRVGKHYEIVDQKIDYVYKDADKVFFPRMSDYTQDRPRLYKEWTGSQSDVPSFMDNIKFFFRYQLNWMYFRYFMWNFVGRQNDNQGYYSWDPSSGNWISGIKFVDDARLYKSDFMPEKMKHDPSRNTYYFIPLILGLLGMFYHYRKRKDDFLAILALFIITGIGIIIYSNQPPSEPRERDYVLAGSMFTFCIWIGLGVLALFDMLYQKIKLGELPAAAIASVLALSAPILMGTQNFDDHSRREIRASRDYASNFLNSVDKNAIIFTYGDNDTYPLWYAQEVEGIRTDVRVVNLSLIAVDWYIDQLNRKVNDSPPVKLSISPDAYRGNKRIQIPIIEEAGGPISIQQALKFIGENHPVPLSSGRSLESYVPSRQIYIPVDKEKAIRNGMISANDTAAIVSALPITLSGEFIMKDDLAVMDVIGSNFLDRPIYFAVTCRQDKMLGLSDYMQLEGLALQIIPVKTASDKRFSVIGNGRVATDKLLDNVTHKFRWGNFDKIQLPVSKSYQPSIQTTRYSILRGVQELIVKGEKDKAITLLDTYFKAFPDMNFPYDFDILPFLQSYVEAGAYDKAKTQMKILTKNTLASLKFYTSLSTTDLERGFSSEYGYTLKTVDEMQEIAKKGKDEAYAKELHDMFSKYYVKKEPVK